MDANTLSLSLLIIRYVSTRYKEKKLFYLARLLREGWQLMLNTALLTIVLNCWSNKNPRLERSSRRFVRNSVWWSAVWDEYSDNHLKRALLERFSCIFWQTYCGRFIALLGAEE